MTIFGIVWWQLLVSILFTLFTIYQGVKTFALIEQEGSLGKGLREAHFDEQDAFTLYDIFRMVFFVPAIIFGVTLVLLKSGALQIFPFLKKILGVKLFAFKK